MIRNDRSFIFDRVVQLALFVGLAWGLVLLLDYLINQKKITSYEGFKFSRYRITSDIDWEKNFEVEVLKKENEKKQIAIEL